MNIRNFERSQYNYCFAMYYKYHISFLILISLVGGNILNLPNKLTIIRVIMIPFFLLFFLGNFVDDNLSRYLAVIIFLVAAITDVLDGYIARSRNLITNFGKFMDPLADKLLVCAALVAMVGTGDLSSIVVIVIISREFIVTGFRIVAASSNIVIAAGFWGKIKTIIQMVMIVWVMLRIDNPYYAIFSDVLIVSSVVLTIISGFEYIYKNLDVLKDSNN
jgi:CDP-diacylglycerol---glycerol-3-phosphate 3-phosphatidyltransferase